MNGGKYLNILVIGDIVGKPGRAIVKAMLSKIQSENNISFTIANAENAAGGRGITRDIKDDLLAMGIDVLTWAIMSGIIKYIQFY